MRGSRFSLKNGDSSEMLASINKSIRDITEDNDWQQAENRRARQRWRSVRNTFHCVVQCKRIAKQLHPEENLPIVTNPNDKFDSGSLLTYMNAVDLLRRDSVRFSDDLPEPPPYEMPSPPEGMSPTTNSLLCMSPNQRIMRRRVHRLGDEISSRHPASARSMLPRDRELQTIDSKIPKWRIAHAEPLISSFAPSGPNQIISEDDRIPLESKDSSSDAHVLKQLNQEKSCVAHNMSHFSLGILDGQSRPQERQHPMLASLSQMDGKSRDADENLGMPSQDTEDRETIYLSRRLESLRWKEGRRGPWVEEPEQLPVSSNARSKHSHPDSRRIAKKVSKPLEGASRSMADFRRIAWLVDPGSGKHVPVEAFVPLMFWFGLTRQHRTALRVFEIAFGPGCVAPDKIAQLALYCDVQVRLVEGFQWLARRESFDDLCDYMIDEERIRSWLSSIRKDPSGRVAIGELQTMFQRMEVTSDNKVLFRFLSTFGTLYNKKLSEPIAGTTVLEDIDSKSHLLERNRFGLHFLMVLLCRCVVTWCFCRVLDLIDPLPSSSSSSNPVDDDGASFRIARRWAEVHRRIVVSLLVNHRYWGRDGKVVLFQLSQPALSVFGQDLKPEQWLALYQRVRAQGMASTFPEGAEFDDPDFLSKKAVSAAARSDVGP